MACFSAIVTGPTPSSSSSSDSLVHTISRLGLSSNTHIPDGRGERGGRKIRRKKERKRKKKRHTR